MERPVQSVPTEVKVGQLFVGGFDGPRPTPAIEDLIESRHLGGVIYFSRNVERPHQLADCSRELQSLALEATGAPLLVATDQEGGVVSRFDWGTQLPSQMALGAADDPDLARRAGRAVGRELAAVGVTTNLAPVLDVNSDPDNPVIGVRSFGDDPDRVGALGAAFADGLQDAGVAACGKHFPGHGDTDTDSHRSLPVVDHDRERLDAVEFRPFRRAVDAGIEALMTTHIAFPAVTGDDGLPATLSRTLLTDVLRDEFGFDGLVVSDCLEMNAIAGTVGVEEGAIRAIEAGCDVVLVSHSPGAQRGAIDAVVEAVESGRLDEGRVDEAFERVRRHKRRYAPAGGAMEREPSGGSVTPDDEQAAPSWEVAGGAARDVAREVARAGVTVVRDRGGTLPLDPSVPCHVVGFDGGRESDAEDDRYDPRAFFAALADRGVEVYSHAVTGDEYTPSFDPGAQVVVATHRARADEAQRAAVAALADAPVDLVVVSLRDPYDVAALPDAGTYLTGYGYDPATVDALAAVVVGAATATGELPMSLPE
ncbi:beta-N-acetylhexosaminidase [Haloarchaeobius iranensis]|nr:beta-N-acetylhexosaminidase [Haloarchaeobius iranensis]